MRFDACKRFFDGTEAEIRLRIDEEDGVLAVRPVTDVGGASDLRPLDPECGVKIRIDPEKPVRYMADWRYSEFWCAPFFGDDPT